PHCGAQQPPGAKFCKACGSSVEPLAERSLGPTPEPPIRVSLDPAPESPAVCPHCGAQEPPGAKFCKACGGTLEDADQPMASSAFVQVAVAAAGAAIGGRDPGRLLAPAAVKGVSRLTGNRLNWLEMLALGAVVALVAGFYLFGLYQFGLQAMIGSGTPIFLAYVAGLLIGLVSFRGLLDRFLEPVYRPLRRIPYRVRLVAGIAVPILWCFLDSKDIGSGFQHAGFTVTVATLLGHVVLRSGEGGR
ncbi:MAG: zinc ribbon domain-containing protein, partial [Candidatus Eremiobacterota bacterium]